MGLVIGRVVSLEGGKASVEPFPTPITARRAAVLVAAKQYVETVEQKRDPLAAWKKLRAAVRELYG